MQTDEPGGQAELKIIWQIIFDSNLNHQLFLRNRINPDNWINFGLFFDGIVVGHVQKYKLVGGQQNIFDFCRGSCIHREAKISIGPDEPRQFAVAQSLQMCDGRIKKPVNFFEVVHEPFFPGRRIYFMAPRELQAVPVECDFPDVGSEVGMPVVFFWLLPGSTSGPT